MCATPAGLVIRKKENLLLVALFLTAGAMILIVHQQTPAGLFGAACFLGVGYGLTNAYASSALWVYFYGDGDAQRIKQASIAITSATSGSAIWLFALSRDAAGTYNHALNVCSFLALGLAAGDLLLLAKPADLEAVVRRAPTWEQMLVWRQRSGYHSVVGQAIRLLEFLSRLRGGAREHTTAFSPSGARRRTSHFQANPIEKEEVVA